MLVTLLLGLSEGESWGWTSPAVLGLFAASACSAVLWVLLELHVDQPLIDIRVLAERPVLLTNVTALISGFAMFGSFVLVPRFVETPGDLPAGIAAQVDYGFGASATTTGLYLLPGSLLMLFAGARRRAARTPRRVEVAAGDRHEPHRDLGRDARGAPDEPWQVCGDGRAEHRGRLRVRGDGRADHGGRRADRDRHRDGDQHG